MTKQEKLTKALDHIMEYLITPLKQGVDSTLMADAII